MNKIKKLILLHSKDRKLLKYNTELSFDFLVLYLLLCYYKDEEYILDVFNEKVKINKDVIKKINSHYPLVDSGILFFGNANHITIKTFENLGFEFDGFVKYDYIKVNSEVDVLVINYSNKDHY
jgi:hypothetical protein